MKFEKKLIMLKGLDYDCKGTVTMEKNASSLKCLINTYGLENLEDGEYFLAVRSPDLPCQMRPLGSLGRISTRFELPLALNIDSLHCIVAEVGKRVEPIMYGSLAPEKLWRGNMLDGLHRYKDGWLIGGVDGYRHGASGLAPIADTAAALSYSKGKLTDYFLDIVPEKAAEPYKSMYTVPPKAPEPQSLTQYADIYEDMAIAEVNYYMGEATDYTEPKGTMGYTPPDYVGEETIFVPPPVSLKAQPQMLESETAEPAPEPPVHNFSDYIKGGEIVSKTSFQAVDSDAPIPKRTLSPNDVGGEEGVLRQEGALLEDDILDETAVTTQALNPAYAIPTIKTYSASAAKTAARAARVKPLTFFDKTRDQIEALFEKYPREERLKDLIDDSRWVKVDWDSKGRHYVVGLIGDGPDYIAYGVPGKYSPEPPKELDGYCQWMPADPKEPEREGYWLMFQDAKTGESVVE